MIPEITIYVTETCPHCHALKNYLDGRHIKYNEVDVEKTEGVAEMIFRKFGRICVPIIAIDGTAIIGFQREALETLLHYYEHA